MRKKLLIFLPILCLATACNQSGSTDDYVPEKITYYVYFMNNYPRAEIDAASGYSQKIDNTLYLRQEIELGKTITKPEDPKRDNYEFQGWFKDKKFVSAWNFESDVAESTMYLYARWQATKSEEYMEPEYHYPETIITDAEYRVTGILNTPVSGDTVDLTSGAIDRLVNSPEDVKFAINYERREDVTLTAATYTDSEKKIHIEFSAGEPVNITVNDISASKKVTEDDAGSSATTYENKAQKYETLGAKYENYHVALGGSSSMENWSTSALDMRPIGTFNHGIGGTKVELWTDKLFDRLIRPYSPKVVAYYVGVNNLKDGEETGEAVGAKLEALFDKTHEALPHTQIIYILINRLPGFPHRQELFDKANEIAIAYAEAHPYVTCLDAGVDLLKEDGTPNPVCFLSDGIHMSQYGYVYWGARVKQAVIDCLDKMSKQ